MITAIAIFAHEIPQEVGDFLILLHSGYSKARALVMNMVSSLASLVGGVLGYFALQSFTGAVPILLGIVAASMIYVAVADLIPGLHKRTELRSTLSQAVLIALGVGSIALATGVDRAYAAAQNPRLGSVACHRRAWFQGAHIQTRVGTWRTSLSRRTR